MVVGGNSVEIEEETDVDRADSALVEGGSAIEIHVQISSLSTRFLYQYLTDDVDESMVSSGFLYANRSVHCHSYQHEKNNLQEILTKERAKIPIRTDTIFQCGKCIAEIFSFSFCCICIVEKLFSCRCFTVQEIVEGNSLHNILEEEEERKQEAHTNEWKEKIFTSMDFLLKFSTERKRSSLEYSL